jgi:bifunctional non-homologous end joining protein LigD
MTQQSEAVTLYFREDTSDKVYQASLETKASGWVVNFAYGRRGSTMTAGTKTQKPVDYGTAKRTYDKLVAEKMAKGYTRGEDGIPYQGTSSEERATGISPQLLNPITEDVAEPLLDDNDWWMQEKFDGKRILVQGDADRITGINRKGLVIAMPQRIVEAAGIIGGDKSWLMDGEAVGDSYFTFDLLELRGKNLRLRPYAFRLAALRELITGSVIRVAETATTTESKRLLLASLRDTGREGVVFKRAAAPYTPGRPASGGDQLKLKFTATASCIVGSKSKTKRSVGLVLFSAIADGARVEVGNVTIPPNKPVPAVGDVVEIRYLYAYPGGSLYQPVYLGQRDDVDPEACSMTQLKHKASNEEEESK